MKRYLVFACEAFYPSGGWEDFIADFDDKEAAEASVLAATKSRSWGHIVDLECGKMVYDTWEAKGWIE